MQTDYAAPGPYRAGRRRVSVRRPAGDVATVHALSLRDGGTMATGTVRTVLR